MSKYVQGNIDKGHSDMWLLIWKKTWIQTLAHLTKSISEVNVLTF